MEQAASRPLPRVAWRSVVGWEHVLLGVAALALLLLVVAPLASLLWGSVSVEGRHPLCASPAGRLGWRGRFRAIRSHPRASRA